LATSLDLGSILNDPGLSAHQKLQIINVIYSTTEADSQSRSQSQFARSTRQYEGILSEVAAASDDSEVEARRAGALPNSNDQASAASKAWATDEDEEMAEGDGHGEGNVEDEDDGEDEDENEGEDEGEDEGKGENESKGEADAEDEDPSVIVIDNEGNGEPPEHDEACGNANLDDEPSPSAPHQLQALSANGDLTGVYSSDRDGDSDGEGASGDLTMLTAAGSDAEED
jgi:hypothetical protein